MLHARPMRGALALGFMSILCSQGRPGELRFPSDFRKPQQVIGGAGGSDGRERASLTHLPVIMIPDNARTRADWLGSNCGASPGKVYRAFLDRGFHPFELWLLDLVSQEGDQLTSLELRTDNLKEMIFAVLEYTGARQVNILGHGAGAVLAQATLVKYNLFTLVHSAAYVAGPFHGTYACSYESCLEGLPLCCNLTPGSDFLQDILIPNETPRDGRSDLLCDLGATRYLTARNGRRFGDVWFTRNPESPALLGARNLSFGRLDHDALRCDQEVLAEVIPFLTVHTQPYEEECDRDGDGFCGRSACGPDCDDANAAIHPGATDTCEDCIDQDCNGVDISCQPGKDRDIPEEMQPRQEPPRERP